MKGKMIFFVIFICIYALFAAMNLTNTTDINFGFRKISNVPIFLSVTVSFALGTLFMLPFVFTAKQKEKKDKTEKTKKKGKDKKEELADEKIL